MPGKRRRPRNLRGPLTATLVTVTATTVTAAVLHGPIAEPDHSDCAGVCVVEPVSQATYVDPTPIRQVRAPGKHRKKRRTPAPVTSTSVPATPTPTPTHTSSPKPTFTSSPRTGLSALRYKVIAAAKTQLGDPYVWGATGPDSWDCSGLVQWAFAQVGIEMPRTSGPQASMGRAVSVSNLNPGDLVAWSGHIALWLGGGRLLEAQRPGTEVHIRYFGTQGGWDDSAYGVALDYSDLPRL